MSRPLQCPHCGASEANLLQDNLYQCKSCGTIYEYGEKDEPVSALKPQEFKEENLPQAQKKITASIVLGIALLIIGFAAAVFFSGKIKTKSSSSINKTLFKNSNETNSSFTVVNAEKGPQVWTLSRRNSDGLTEVSYFLNRVDALKNKVISSLQIGNTITWKQSFEDAYKIGALKAIGNICYVTNGNQLIGFDVNTQQQIVNNDTLIKRFSPLVNGIAAVEDVYDLDGFQLTTKEGYKFYYIPVPGKLLTEKEYNDRKSTDDEVSTIQYVFTDSKRQQLYKINRKTGKIFKNRLNASILSNIINDKSDWYKKTYKINSLEEFISGEIFFNGNVLYADENKILIVYQTEAEDNSPVEVKYLSTDQKLLWTRSGADAAVFKPMVKSGNTQSLLHGNQLVVIQPYQEAICLNDEDGSVLWVFKPY
ncbi:MAG: peptide transporter [Bacteroidota bacterium]|nr:peptide transporter [Bacteroidota bacterium]